MGVGLDHDTGATYPVPVNVMGLTTIQLKSELPSGFDPTIWQSVVSLNGGYPSLKWQTAGVMPGEVINFGGLPSIPLTWSVANSSLTYGTLASPGAAMLSGVSAADSGLVIPTVGLFSGNAPVSLSSSIPAGSYNEEVVAITGTAASRYTLSATGNTFGTLTINPKALTWAVSNASFTYGSTPSLGTATLNGIVGSDDVSGNVSVVGASNLSPTTSAGSYTENVMSLSGTTASNYILATSGNTSGALTINPKTLTWSVSDASYISGSSPSLGTATLSGVVGQDNVAGTVGAFNGANAVSVSSSTLAGSYIQNVTGLTGTSANNYTLASTGNTPGTLTVFAAVTVPNILTWNVANASSTYGSLPTLGTATLSGVSAADSGLVIPNIELFKGGTEEPLSATLPAGAYTEEVVTITGTAASHYTLSSAGTRQH